MVFFVDTKYAKRVYALSMEYRKGECEMTQNPALVQLTENANKFINSFQETKHIFGGKIQPFENYRYTIYSVLSSKLVSRFRGLIHANEGHKIMADLSAH